MKQGDRLKNRYEIQKILGTGGSSRVYLAYDRIQERNRAVKEIRRFQGVGEQAHKMMVRQETELIRRLDYPYFPQNEEVLEEEEAFYIIM